MRSFAAQLPRFRRSSPHGKDYLLGDLEAEATGPGDRWEIFSNRDKGVGESAGVPRIEML